MMRDVTPRSWWAISLFVSGVIVAPPFLAAAIFVNNYPGWIFLAAIPFLWAGWFLLIASIRSTFSMIRTACQRVYFRELRKHGILHKADPAALVHGSAAFAEYEGLLQSGHLEPDAEKACRMPVLDGSFDNPRILGRPLIGPDEVMKMARNVGLLFIEGQPPVLVGLLPYYNTVDFEGLYDRWEG